MVSGRVESIQLSDLCSDDDCDGAALEKCMGSTGYAFLLCPDCSAQIRKQPEYKFRLIAGSTNESIADKAIVTLDNAPSGLAPGSCELEGFEIAGADKKFYPAKARIAGRTRNVEVWSDQVAQPVAVRYAFRNYVGNITLRNTLGIAAFPFRTDTWDDVK